MLYLFRESFQIGYDDVRLNHGKWNSAYEEWDQESQKHYEMGRQLFTEFGDLFRMRNMKSVYSETIYMSEVLSNLFLSTLRF
jgi:hypothetical protein